MKRLGLLVAGVLAMWCLLAMPAKYLWGEAAVVYTAVAAGVCLVPTAVTLICGIRVNRTSPELLLVTVLGATGLRMAAVLGVGLVLYLNLPYFHATAFWISLLIFYLATLALETTLLVGHSPNREPLNEDAVVSPPEEVGSSKP
jgi:hypothetical protein